LVTFEFNTNGQLKFSSKNLEELFLFPYSVFSYLNQEMPRGMEILTELSQVVEKFNWLWFKIQG